MKISVVIPCYRSQDTIEAVVDSVQKSILKRQDVDYEIILVNDGSPDNVWEVIDRLCVKDNHIKAINLAKNFGQHSALMAGYGYVAKDSDYVVSMDDDGQSSAEHIYTLVDAIREGYDVVYADYEEKQENSFRIFGSKINEKMNEVMIGKPKGIVPNSYYIAKSFIIREMVKYENAFPYVDGLIFRATKNIGKVAIPHKPRTSGSSGYTLGKLVSLWMNGFTAFSIKPLRISTVIGSICAIGGFIFGIIVIIRRINDSAPVSGWSSTIAILLFIGGMIMLMLGMVGEYLGRVYLCLNKSPQYVVRELKNFENMQ